MKKATIILLLLLSLTGNRFLHAASIFPGLTGKALVDSLRKYYKPTRTLSDAGCRDTVYGEIDLLNGDSLICVYSGWTIRNFSGDPSTWANANDINPEHTWPESLLDSTKATQDMQHLFPTEMGVNSYRSSLPFGECADASTTTWSRNNVHQSSIPGANINEWSETISNARFEPREIQKGKTARAMYYMLTMWQIQDTTLAWWTGQKDTLYKWHCQHPADAAESTRTYRVAPHQSNKINPFVLDSTLIRRAYFPSIPTNTQLNFASASATYGEAAGAFSLTVNIYSPSGSAATTVQVVLTGGTGTAADVNNYTTQTLTFPAGSSTPQSATVIITDDALLEPAETIVFRLRNTSGGSSAAVGGDSVFTLTINDNDTPVSTAVSFSPAYSDRTEGDAPFNITVAIADPSGSAATTADVVLASGTGSAADINNYVTQTVTFPAGSSASQTVPITITDDLLVEGTETLVFKLSNVTGGISAAAGSDSAYALTLADNDGGSTGGQVIGSFADMDGGFDLQNGTLAVVTGITSAQTAWTVSAATGTISNTGGRSSPKYAVFTQTGTSHRRLQSPTVTTMTASTQYVIQFYYQGDLDGGAYGDIRGAACQVGTSAPVYGSYVTGANSGLVWTKYTAAVTTNSTVPTVGLGIVSVNNTAQFNIDDFVVYPGAAVDNTAPNRPDTVNVSGTKGEILSVTWPAASGGVDGGGYLLVRGTSDPATAPNVNGIYYRGNSIGAGTVAYIGTATSLADTGLAPSTTYYYRVYTVDKAFNYSGAATGKGTTGSALGVALSGFSCGLAGDDVTVRWRTESETNSYLWIIARSDQADGQYDETARLEAAGNSGAPGDYAWTDTGVESGRTYYYRLTGLDLTGERTQYGPVSITLPGLTPAVNSLIGAHPNPFRGETSISYQLSVPGTVGISIYNAAGQLVRTINRASVAGVNSAVWNGKDRQGRRAVPGVYFYRAYISGKYLNGRLVLVR
jgi:hypothetical protein